MNVLNVKYFLYSLIIVKLAFEEQINQFISNKNKSLWVENLFYTSSQYCFLGVLKLWLYDTSGSGIFHQALKEGNRRQSVIENDQGSGNYQKLLQYISILFF